MKVFRNLKTMYKIMLPTTLLLIVAFGAIGYTISQQSTDALRHVAQREMEALGGEYGNAVKARIEVGLNQAEALARAFAGMRENGDVMDRDLAVQLVQSVIAKSTLYQGGSTGWEPDAFDGMDAQFQNAPYHDKTGRFVPYVYPEGGTYKVTALPEYDVPGDGDYYLVPKRTRKPFVTPPYHYTINGNELLLATTSAPIMVHGSFKGVVTLDLSIQSLNDMVDAITPYDTGFAFLMTSGGSVVAHPNKDYVLKNIFDVVNLEHERDLRSAMAQGKPFSSEHISQVTGERSLVQYIPIPLGQTGQYWYLGINAPIAKITAEATALSQAIIIAAVITVLLLLVALYFVARSISKPMGMMASMAQDVAQGNFDAKVDASGFGGEILTLHSAMETMVAGLVKNISKAEEMTKEAKDQTAKAQVALRDAEKAREEAENAKREGMLEAADELAGIVSQVSSATEELAAQIQESNRGSDVQRERTSEAATAMEQMNASVLEVAQNAGQAAESADQARKEAESGGDVVGNVVTNITRVHEMSTSLERSLGELGEQAEGIGQIMNVITDIADQTNLLALNAAIEAARAGDAGRGFAVVADEVRKLAEKTMAATKQVGESVKSIQNGTHTNISNMAQATAEVTKSTELAQQAGEALERIVSIVDSTADQVRNIATASEEQSAASEQISHSTEEVNTIAQENAQAMDESTRAVTELTTLAGRLSTVIDRLRDA
ncbi:hypothetical protein JCM16814_34280 [Desulfobaculum senezii]